MGNNKNKKKQNKNKKKTTIKQPKLTEEELEERNKKYPLVSVCTPTYNRRPFIPAMLQCFNHQIYPRDRMEWIIIDDGTDKIEDLVVEHPNVKYFKYDEKMTLGKKRNVMHEKCSGDIIVYMDDDDYYPPQRVSHAVEMLQKHTEALCAGSSELYIFFKHVMKTYKFGPYGEKHATAGTFAFKKELLVNNKYDETASVAEERSFLNNYTVPFVQLDSMKTILVVSHEHNTFDKRKLLDNVDGKIVKEDPKKMEDFIKQKWLKDFFMNINEKLKTYDPGKPEMKPDVLLNLLKIEEKRRKHAEELLKNLKNNGTGIIQEINGEKKTLSKEEVINILQTQKLHMQKLVDKIKILESNPHSSSSNKTISISNMDGSGTRNLTYEEILKLLNDLQNNNIYHKKQNEKLRSILKDNNIDVKEEDLVVEKLDLNKDLMQTNNNNSNNSNNTNISVEVLEKDEADSDDVKMIIDQTGCTREVARSTLQKNNNDIVNTIIEITDKSTS